MELDWYSRAWAVEPAPDGPAWVAESDQAREPSWVVEPDQVWEPSWVAIHEEP